MRGHCCSGVFKGDSWWLGEWGAEGFHPTNMNNYYNSIS